MTAHSQNIMLSLLYHHVEIITHFKNTLSNSLSKLWMTTHSQNIMLSMIYLHFEIIVHFKNTSLIYLHVEITAHFKNTFSDSLSKLRMTAHSQNIMLSLIYLHVQITAHLKTCCRIPFQNSEWQHILKI